MTDPEPEGVDPDPDEAQWDSFDREMLETFQKLEVLTDADWEAIREIFRSIVGQRVTSQLRDQLAARLRWALRNANDVFKDPDEDPEDMLITSLGYPTGTEGNNSLSRALSLASDGVKYQYQVLRQAYGDWVDDVVSMMRRGEQDWDRIESDYHIRLIADHAIPFVTLSIFGNTGDATVIDLPVSSSFRLVRGLVATLNQMPDAALPEMDADDLTSTLGRAIGLLQELVERVSEDESEGGGPKARP